MESQTTTTGSVGSPDPQAPSSRDDGHPGTVVAGRRSAENNPVCRDGASSPVTEAWRKRMSRDGVGRSGSGSPEDRRNGGVSTSSSKGKRKMGVISKESSPTLTDGASRRPLGKKPMHEQHDAITWRNHPERRTAGYDDEASGSRSTGARHAEEGACEPTSPLAAVGAAAAATEEEKIACHHDLLKFGDNQVSDALLVSLAELGASAPWFVDRKQLTSTDVRVDQNRLQISSKSPISRAFTDAEKAGVRTGAGIPVMAFDRGGEAYVLKCKLFRGKNYYRLRGPGWREFLDKNNLGIGSEEHLQREVMVELWAFRSRSLPKGENGDEGSGHPDGELGLVVLHRDEGEGGEHELVEVAPVPPEVENAEDDSAAVGVQVQEEVAADAYAEDGEAGAHAARYETKRLEVAAAVLLVLRTSDRTRSKLDYVDVGKGDASMKRLRFKSAVP